MVTAPETFISFLWGIIDNKIVSLFIIAILLLTFLYYVKRKAQSGFSIANRIFMLFLRNKERNTKELIDEIIDIERFNFYYNTQAISLRQATAFETWIRKYELDFRIISKLKNKLDIEYLKITKVRRISVIFYLASSLLVIALGLQTLIIANTNSLLIKIDDSNWFWVNKDKATSFSILQYKNTPWVITDESCKTNATISSLSKEHTAIICKFLDDHKGLHRLNALIKQQKLFFSVLSVFLIIFFIMLVRTWLHLSYAFDARTMVYRKIKKFRAKRRKKINII
ncbi:hypothetical protein JJQ12_24440 [Enterobacter hormaechei]|nr:hypothetical protein [Enterobacter hormaechei]